MEWNANTQPNLAVGPAAARLLPANMITERFRTTDTPPPPQSQKCVQCGALCPLRLYFIFFVLRNLRISAYLVLGFRMLSRLRQSQNIGLLVRCVTFSARSPSLSLSVSIDRRWFWDFLIVVMFSPVFSLSPYHL